MAIGFLLPSIVIDSFGTQELEKKSCIIKWDKMTLNQSLSWSFI